MHYHSNSIVNTWPHLGINLKCIPGFENPCVHQNQNTGQVLGRFLCVYVDIFTIISTAPSLPTILFPTALVPLWIVLYSLYSTGGAGVPRHNIPRDRSVPTLWLSPAPSTKLTFTQPSQPLPMSHCSWPNDATFSMNRSPWHFRTFGKAPKPSNRFCPLMPSILLPGTIQIKINKNLVGWRLTSPMDRFWDSYFRPLPL